MGVAGLLAAAVGACSFDAQPPETTQVEEKSEIAAGTPLRVPTNAVVGVIERYQDGRLTESQVLDRTDEEPADFEARVADGAPGPDGYAYVQSEGAYSDDGREEVRYHFVLRERVDTVSSEKPLPSSAVPVVVDVVDPPRPRVETRAAQLAEQDPTADASVYVRLTQPFSTSIATGPRLISVSLRDAESGFLAKRNSIAIRKAEALSLQSAVGDLVVEMGGTVVTNFWTSNAIEIRLPAGKIPVLAEHPSVARVELSDSPFLDLGTSDWDGDDIKAAGGLNAAAYHDKGFHGEAFANNPGGRIMRVAVIGDGFDTDHPGFRDCVGCGFRVVAKKCEDSPCSNGNDTPAPHATKVAGLVAGSIRQHQISGYTDQQELERSGATEEAEVWLMSIDGYTSHIKRAIELAMDNDIDVMVSSTGVNSGTMCDSYVGSDLQETIYAAQQQSLIFVQAAGNSGDPGSCNIIGMGEAPSAFAVGAVAGSATACTKANYSTCGLGSYSSRGGMAATVSGYSHPEAVSLVDAVTVGCPLYGFNTDGTIYEPGSGACGTSYAAPQVGGVGILIKDWFLDQGYNTINTEGRLYAVMLAMTDRAPSATAAGFDRRWGGGRFQARFNDSADLGAYAWDTYSAVLSNGQVSQHAMAPAGLSSSSLNQLKAYAVFFEEDKDDMADIDLEIKDKDCGAGSVQLGKDDSYDVKSMVRLGTQARSKDICIQASAWRVPPGETRRVHIYSYYSQTTGMR